MRLQLVLIAEAKWRNMIFKNYLRFLTSKRLVCLPEFFWKNAVLSAINALKWWSLKLLSSRRITKSLVSSTKRLLKSWLKRLLWPILPHQLVISTSTVIRKLNDFHFEHDFSRLPEIMSWDEYAFTEGKMSFIAQDFDKLNIITVLEGRTQAIIRNHFDLAK